MNKETFKALRDEVMKVQLELSKIPFSEKNDRRLMQEVWEKNPHLSLAEKFALNGKIQLQALEFVHSPEEPLIGRVKTVNYDPGEQQKAKEKLSELGLMMSPGQTGHAEPFYDEVFAVGLDGIRNRAQDTTSFVMAVDAVSSMIEHAAQYAVRDDVAAMCHHIAHHPPRNFREAIQLLWFVCLAIQSGDRVALIGPGRIDRRLIKFYEADIAAGTLTRSDALEMIALLYLYVNQYCQRGLAYAVMVGGSGIYNELSYLALEALRMSKLVYPTVGVCWEEATPPALRELTIELISEGISNVAVFGDDLIKRSMIRYGVPEQDAGEYINSTCVEITPCGQSNVYVASPYFSLCHLLIETMEATRTADYAVFLNEYRTRLAEKIKNEVADMERCRQMRLEGTRRPIQSIFTRDCISRKLDIEEGGAVYNWIECSFVGLANLVDSLYVLRKEVFEEKNLTMQEMLKILADDFENNEALRQKFLNHYPKYGNADPEVDGSIAELTRFIDSECAKYKVSPGNSHYIPGTFCWIKHQLLGAACGATPDGRHKGFPFADGAGPAQGREKQGPTAAIQSVCSWDHSCMLGGSAFNQRYSKAAVDTPGKRKKLETLVDVFIRSGGFETQINILDAETLRQAQKDPESYRDLVVRIGGYTDYYVGLSPEMQAELIMRTIYQDA